MYIGGIDSYREMSALKAAKIPGETKRMAAFLLEAGRATSADEAIIKASEDSQNGASFQEYLDGAMAERSGACPIKSKT